LGQGRGEEGKEEVKRATFPTLLTMIVVEMTCGLEHASYSLPKWQTVKQTFFAPHWVRK